MSLPPPDNAPPTPPNAAPVAVHLYQVAYSGATLAAVEPGYEVLDNLANPRPDWYEYWPMRQFLQTQTLDDDAFYGIFSPKFGAKTALSHADVVATVRHAAPTADVVLFSPQPDMGAFFLNVFEQAETFDPGFIAAASAWLDHSGRSVLLANPLQTLPPLQTLVMDTNQIVFSNYFVARPAFWRSWLALNETLFAICEGPASPLQEQLTYATHYPGSAQRKVFLQERNASLLLTVQKHWRTHAANPFTMGWSASRFREHPMEAVMSDALKLAFREHGFPHYMQAFSKLRERFIAGG
jgi:hypothetical protein